jgi:hypothetical protein
VVDKLIARTWKAPLLPGYKGELQTMVNDQVLKYLLQLAANNRASAIVRGQALLKIEDLKTWMTSTQLTAQPAQRASMLFALTQIEAFKQDPNKFQPPAATDMPPGAPIGMPNMDWFNDAPAY